MRTQSQSADDVDVYTGKQLAAACDRYNLPDDVRASVWELIEGDQLVAYGFNHVANLDEQDHLNLVRWTEQRATPN